MNSSKGNNQSPKKNDSLLARAARANTAYRQQSLRKIRRARTRLLVCFWTLPVYIIAVWLLLSNGRSVNSIMWVYIALYALFAVDMARRSCPQCKEQFFVKTVLLNLRTRRCVHCELPLQASDTPEEP